MSLRGVNIRSQKISSDYLFDNADSCEIRAELITAFPTKDPDQYSYEVSITFISQGNKRFKTTDSVIAPNLGNASVKIVCMLIEKIDGVKFKNVSIFYDSQYVVSTIPKLAKMIANGKVSDSPNKLALIHLHKLLQTVGKRYAISIKKSKVVKDFDERRSYE